MLCRANCVEQIVEPSALLFPHMHPSQCTHIITQASFHSTLEKLKPRPWVVDDLDAALDVLVGPTGPTMGPTGPSMGLTGLANSVNEQSKTRIQANTTINTTNNTTNTTNTTNNSNLLLKYQRKVVLLVDNAGSDVVLGMLPLARQLLASRPQCTVVLGANELPSINDVTACELRAVVEGASAQLGAQDVLSLVRAVVVNKCSGGARPPHAIMLLHEHTMGCCCMTIQ